MEHLTTTGDRHVAAPATEDRGFTLVEILIAIVLIGVLSAVAVVGISSLTDRGSESACEASLDAAKAASVVYYASNANTYPKDFAAMTTGDDPPLELPSGAAADGPTVTAGDAWTLTMTVKDGSKPTFVCS